MADAEQSRRRVQSIEVGFRVLRVLRMAEGPLPLREVAARATMPPSKVHLYLVSFVRENMAYQDPRTGFYGLGSFAIQLGLAAVRQLDIVGAAGEVLNDLRDRTDCAVYLSLWGDQGPCVVAKADGNLQGAFTLRLGYILPVGTTATGQIFVTWLAREDVERVMATQHAASTPHMIRARDRAVDLDEIAATVRERGYGSTAGRLNQNFAGLAAPIFDADGKLGAALTLLGPADYVSDERQKQFAAMLTEAAASVTQRVAAV